MINSLDFAKKALLYKDVNAVNMMCEWRNTPQGHDYWEAIFRGKLPFDSKACHNIVRLLLIEAKLDYRKYDKIKEIIREWGTSISV